MKIKIKAVLACFPLSAILIWSAAAQPDPDQSNQAPEGADQSDVERMDQRRGEIRERVGMSAPLELPPAGEEDFVAEALEQGLIVEATLEEVEAALNAAKATPGLEDDFAALKLAHWGSYRFFLDEAPTTTSRSAR